MALDQKLKLQLLLFILASISNSYGIGMDASETVENLRKTVKNSPLPSLTQPSPGDIKGKYHDSAPKSVISIEEKPRPNESNTSIPVTSNIFTNSQIHVEETNFKKKIFPNESEMPESFQMGFYFFLALSTTAVIFILVKVYRLRLSRAERKYGVQGDRTTQELTPLPISIEDANSDDDDQTLYELNRQQIRIL